MRRLQTQRRDSAQDAAERAEEKERLNQLVLEMRKVLSEMCKYTEEEVEEDAHVQILEEAKQRIAAESLPTYKLWAKENGIFLPKTKHESETMFRRKKKMRLKGLIHQEHFSNTKRSKDRKSEIAEQKKFQRAKRKEIKAKRRHKQESNESTAGDELQSEIDD